MKDKFDCPVCGERVRSHPHCRSATSDRSIQICSSCGHMDKLQRGDALRSATDYMEEVKKKIKISATDNE